jgi:sterol desaturase/sphingolipid hydroxylase (fatty acid hydroxylase superfamily)
MVWRICRTYDSHVGYEFPWSPFSIFPFCASSEYHNFHHSHNVSNY